MKIYTQNLIRKIKICFHNTFSFPSRVYKDKMSSSSFRKYLYFRENLRRQNPSDPVPQF